MHVPLCALAALLRSVPSELLYAPNAEPSRGRANYREWPHEYGAQHRFQTLHHELARIFQWRPLNRRCLHLLGLRYQHFSATLRQVGQQRTSRARNSSLRATRELGGCENWPSLPRRFPPYSARLECSCAWMRCEIGRLQSFFADMRVALSGDNICVTQKFLNCAQVGAIVEQMRGKGVSQCVWVSCVN